jgi:hypothetical protein
MENQERKCCYIDMLNHICGNVTRFKVLINETSISSSLVVDVSELLHEYKESVLATREVRCSR